MLGNLNNFHFYQLIPLHTEKIFWRLRHDSKYVSNCRTLKESRKICCRVLGFHRLITSEDSTHTPRCSTLTPRFFVSGFGFVVEFWVFIDWSHPSIPHAHTHYDARRSPHDFLFPCFGFVSEFWVFIDWSHPNIPHTHHDARRPPHDFSFLSFPGTIFPKTIFPRTIFPGFVREVTQVAGTQQLLEGYKDWILKWIFRMYGEYS